jgi:hypothetical protein
MIKGMYLESRQNAGDVSPEIPSDELDIIGAVYNVDTGRVDWLEEEL